DPDSMRAATAACVERFGRLDGAVLCAGILTAERTLGRNGPLDLGAFERTIRVNLIGTCNAARLAAEAMSANAGGEDGERGVIVMTSSVAAYDGQIGQLAYAASKGGVASMTLPMARDLARHGIRVVSIAPGAMETPMVAGMTEAVR